MDPAEVLPIRARSFVAWRLAQDDVKFFGFKVTFALLWPTLPQRTRERVGHPLYADARGILLGLGAAQDDVKGGVCGYVWLMVPLAGTLRVFISTSEALASTFVIDGGGLECPLYRNKCQASR